MKRAGAPIVTRFGSERHATERSSLLTQKRFSWVPFWYHSAIDWVLPNGVDETDGYTNFLKGKKFATKSRKQWDYNRIDENISSFSEFRKMHNRPDFDGPRENNYPAHNASMKNPPGTKKLFEYFDEYTKPGSDKKLMAAMAVQEQWDAENYYYPGESWEHNRPAFRSVPKEICNKMTTYRMSDFVKNFENIQASTRNRAWNPMWPPPGYKLPEFTTKREFAFGSEDPGLVAEVERWYWHKMWHEANIRLGFYELIGVVFSLYLSYFIAKNHMSNYNLLSVVGNQWYPGAHFVTSFGEPTHEGGKFWWQTDMKDWPVQIQFHTMREMRYGYINYLKRKKAREEAEASL